jgi:cell wall-associated NlpC family hydrolase
VLTLLTAGATAMAVPTADINQVQQQVMDLQMKAEAATERANAARNALDGIRQDLSTVKNRADRERAQVGGLMATINDIARNAYASGGMDPTLQVLLAEDPAEFLAQAAVMGQLEQSQIDQLRQTQTARLRLAQTEAEIADKESAAQAANAEMQAAEADAAEQLQSSQDLLATLKEEERQRLAELARQKRQQEMEAARRAASAAKVAADNGNPSSPAGGGSSNDYSNDASQGGSVDTGGSQDSGSSPSASAAGGGFSGGTKAMVAVQYALAQVGKGYVAAADGPSVYDCSGLTMAAYRQAGVSLAHLSYSQFDQTRRVPVSEIQPGDLVFYFGGGAHHVGMYVGNGKMVSASNPSDGVELIDFLGPWYGDRFSGVGRVVG